jgi:hypothetical protein
LAPLRVGHLKNGISALWRRRGNGLTSLGLPAAMSVKTPVVTEFPVWYGDYLPMTGIAGSLRGQDDVPRCRCPQGLHLCGRDHPLPPGIHRVVPAEAGPRGSRRFLSWPTCARARRLPSSRRVRGECDHRLGIRERNRGAGKLAKAIHVLQIRQAYNTVERVHSKLARR